MTTSNSYLEAKRFIEALFSATSRTTAARSR